MWHITFLLIGGKRESVDNPVVSRPASKKRGGPIKRGNPRPKVLKKDSEGSDRPTRKSVKRKSDDHQNSSVSKQPKTAGVTKSKPAKDRRRQRNSSKSATRSPAPTKANRKSSNSVVAVTPKLNVTSDKVKANASPHSSKVKQSNAEVTPSRKATAPSKKKTPKYPNRSDLKSTPGKAKRQSIGKPKTATPKPPTNPKLVSTVKKSPKSVKKVQ